VKVWPLLRGQVEIGDVQLIAPSARLITDAQGRHNWDDLAGSNADAATPPATSSGAVNATIAGIEIQGGEVVLDDRRDNSRTALRNFSLRAQGIGSGKPFDLRTAFAIEQGDAASTYVELSANVNADWNNKRYALTQLNTRIALRSAGLPKDGLPVAVRAEAAALDLAQQTMRLDGLQLSVGVAQINGALAGTEIIDKPTFTGHVALAAVSLPELFKQMNITPPATRDTQVLKQLSFESDVVATTESVALQKIALKLDDTTARGEFGVADFKAKAVRFDLDVDRIDFDRYLPPVAETQPVAGAQPSAPTPIPVDLLRTLNARGELRVGDAKFSGLKLSKLTVGLNARDGDVRIAPAQAALYGGGYQGDITLNVAGQQPRLALNAKVANVDFAPLLKDMVDTERMSGRGSFNANLTAVGMDTHAMLKKLNGTLDFNVADGAYEGMDLWYEIRRARAVIKQQPIPERVGAERTAFTAIKGTGAVQDGVMSNQDLNVAMQYLKVDGKGTVNLVDSTLDYRFNSKVLRIPPEGTAGSEMTELVDAEIPITAKGPLASPKVRPDVEGYIKARAKQEIKKETDKLQEKVQEKLQDKLKDLLRR
jgi:AsmA protein